MMQSNDTPTPPTTPETFPIDVKVNVSKKAPKIRRP